jgi:hypothetical protein
MKTLATNIVNEIAEMTDTNQHMRAALVLAYNMTSEVALCAQLDLMWMIDEQEFYGYNRNFAKSYEVTKGLMSEAQKTFTNADEIYASF